MVGEMGWMGWESESIMIHNKRLYKHIEGQKKIYFPINFEKKGKKATIEFSTFHLRRKAKEKSIIVQILRYFEMLRQGNTCMIKSGKQDTGSVVYERKEWTDDDRSHRTGNAAMRLESDPGVSSLPIIR